MTRTHHLFLFLGYHIFVSKDSPFGTSGCDGSRFHGWRSEKKKSGTRTCRGRVRDGVATGDETTRKIGGGEGKGMWQQTPPALHQPRSVTTIKGFSGGGRPWRRRGWVACCSAMVGVRVRGKVGSCAVKLGWVLWGRGGWDRYEWNGKKEVSMGLDGNDGLRIRGEDF